MYCKQVSEATLREMYEDRKLTQAQIAQELKVSERSIRRWMALYKIEGRLYIGEDNARYKHGRSCGSHAYKRTAKRERCAACGSSLNLGVHHQDFDHYNNASENLQVLCVSCHMSLHKQAYWDAIHAGKEPARSNGPVGWFRESTGTTPGQLGALPAGETP
jgi:hypothetical protein